MVKSKMLFILIGNDQTGKTTFQKLLIQKICNHNYKSLPVNLKFPINHPEIKRKYHNISFGSRSYQEKINTYGSIDKYFKSHFNPADISIISSHLVKKDIEEMIKYGKMNFYNVFGVFWTNSIELDNTGNSNIATFDWHEILEIGNTIRDDENQIKDQLNLIVESFVDFLINRTSIS